MATLAAHQSIDAAPAHWTQGNPDEDTLAHIPGEKGWPLVGNTFKMLADPHGMAKAMVAKYGRVYKNKAFGGWNVALIGADANELVLFDREKLFSSEQGWGPILDRLFPRGLMLMDFDHHRADRPAGAGGRLQRGGPARRRNRGPVQPPSGYGYSALPPPRNTTTASKS